MSVQVWLSRLEQMNPSHIELGLDRVKAVWNALPNFSNQTKIVVVGGTNGKGSCVLAMEHMLRQQGVKVGAYLSPHLVRFNERIRLDQREISDVSLCEHLERVERARLDVDLTYFEFTTLAALSFFTDEVPDVVILEVGLGGRLDAVNILATDIAILTSVDLDHQDWLGNDLESIGREKAGIFRSNSWAILGSYAMPDSVYRQAEAIGAQVLARGKDFDILEQEKHCLFQRETESWSIPDIPVSRSSLAAAICAVQILQSPLEQTMLNGLADLRLPARFQRLMINHRECILDSAHNPAAAENLSQMLVSEGISKVDVVLGMMADKDVRGFVKALAPRVKRWLTVRPETDRALTTGELESIIKAESTAEVVDVGSIKSLKIDELVESRPTLVCGSFYTVGEFIRYHTGGPGA